MGDESRWERTIAGPGHASAELGHLLVDLGPDLARAVPVGGCLALGDLGDVEGHGARVGNGGLGVVVEDLASRDRVGLGGACAGVALVAPDLVRGDVRHGPVALEVGGRPDILPVGGGVDTGEGV